MSAVTSGTVKRSSSLNKLHDETLLSGGLHPGGGNPQLRVSGSKAARNPTIRATHLIRMRSPPEKTFKLFRGNGGKQTKPRHF